MMSARHARANLPGEYRRGQAGGLVNITWDDVNDGTSPAIIAFTDRVVVRIWRASGAGGHGRLYDPNASTAASANGIIQPGSSAHSGAVYLSCRMASRDGQYRDIRHPTGRWADRVLSKFRQYRRIQQHGRDANQFDGDTLPDLRR